MIGAVVSSNDDWQKQCDYETLVKAEEIKQDKKRLEAALGYGKSKKEAVEAVDDLKSFYGKKLKEVEGSEEKEDEE